jgi:hypothetical protein
VDAPVRHGPESELSVEAQRGVEALHVDRDRTARGRGLPEERPDELRPDAPVAECGEQGDVDDADLVRPPGDVEAAGCLTPDADDAEVRPRVLLAVPGVLGPELLVDEQALAVVVPVDRLELGRSRAAVDLAEECFGSAASSSARVLA